MLEFNTGVYVGKISNYIDSGCHTESPDDFGHEL
jgi:hypothetical protein